MTVRRRHTPGLFSLTKGHSAIRQRSYGIPGRRVDDDVYYDTYAPRALLPSPRRIHQSHESDYLTSTVDRAGYLSSATLNEVGDIAAVSRAKDAQLLQSATSALVKGGAPSTTKALVATKRVTGSVPPPGCYQPVLYSAPPPPRKIGREVAIQSVSYKPIVYVLPSSGPSSSRKPIIVTRSQARTSPPPSYGTQQVENLTRQVSQPIAEAKEIAARSLIKQRASVPVSARLKRRHETVMERQSGFPKPVVKKHPPLPRYAVKKLGRRGRRAEAAIVAGKVDVERSSRRPRRPKSQYATEKYRQIRIDQAQASQKNTSPSGGSATGLPKDSGNSGVSSTRRRLRKTLAKSKNDPSYYD